MNGNTPQLRDEQFDGYAGTVSDATNEGAEGD